MSNSNHCAGRTLGCKARETYSGPLLRIVYDPLCQFYTYFSQFYRKNGQIFVIFYELLSVVSDSLV